uniref:DNA methylase N-4/N-6 domain-containing protein n=1 Tax=viral metagenome TaxID=1070528 RepID=A0A6C0I2K5_9ZZZZ
MELKDWLAKFTNGSAISLEQFKETAVVKIRQNIKPLSQYAEEKSIPEEDIQLLFENIQNRNGYLTRFYNTSLRVLPNKIKLHDLTPMTADEINNNQLVYYKNWIRNLHADDILENTKSGIENNVTYLTMLQELYNEYIIDYKILTPSARHYMKAGRIGSVFSSYYFRASIMNPYVVYSLNQSCLLGTRIFTPTLGWSSYCYGFLECPQVCEYVGTDVIPSVCRKTEELAKTLAPHVRTNILCEPSEDLLLSKPFMTAYKDHFDVVFFSPPYYRLELYCGGEQSTDRYKTYEEWLVNYWLKTIQLCYHVLEKGGRLCYILSGYGSTNKGSSGALYNLVEDMNAITERFFVLLQKMPMKNKDVHVTKHKETNETIMIFVKK